MCTALNLTVKDHYFGRTLDLDCSYGEEVVVVPRNMTLEFRNVASLKNHHAFIGMATVVGNVPLFYDGVNEHGLCMAGLNFPSNATYYDEVIDKDNVTPFEFIPWILSKCKNLDEAKTLLNRINLVNVSFSDKLSLSPLHWIISDKNASVVVETMSDGVHIYDNPVGVMTNNPPFPLQLFNLNNYRNLRVTNGENGFSPNLPLDNYCQGLGAVGLPGDVSSMSRFVRIAFSKENSVCDGDETSAVSQFFHLIGSVEMVKGVCKVPNGHYDLTVYTSCVNADKGIYYYTTYGNHQISAVDMRKVDLDGATHSRFPLVIKQQINYQN